MTETADAVIIGGGVIGTSIAYHLARIKFGRIVLLERDSLASGSTGRSVATIDALTLQRESVALYAQSVHFFQNCEEILGRSCGYVQTGSLFLGGTNHEPKLRTAVTNMQAAGIDVRVLTLPEIMEVEPRINLEGIAAGGYAVQGGHADPALTTYAFAGAAKSMGVQIDLGRLATTLLSEGNRINGVATTSGTIHSPLVVVAAGPWSKELLQPLKVDLPLKIISHPVVSIRRPANFDPPHPALLDLTSGIYARSESKYLTLSGSLDPQVGHIPVDPYGPAGYADDAYILWVMERLTHRFPELAASEIAKGWAGFMTLSPDWQPVIGTCPNWNGLYCAVGFSGLGFQTSPAVGDLLSRFISGEKKAASILAPFSPNRFSTGDLLPTYREEITQGAEVS